MGFLLYSLLFAIGSLLYYGNQIIGKSHPGRGRFWLPALVFLISLLEEEGKGILDYFGWCLAHIFVPGILICQFYMFIRGKGQETVEKQYVAVGKASTFVSLKPKGTIMVDGSTSIAPLMEVIAEEYMQQNPEAEIVIEESDSSKGIDSVIKRNAEIAMSSRELKDYEKELLDYETIAKEGIAVVVNEENPLETITLEQLRKIYIGEIDSWKQLNE